MRDLLLACGLGAYMLGLVLQPWLLAASGRSLLGLGSLLLALLGVGGLVLLRYPYAVRRLGAQVLGLVLASCCFGVAWGYLRSAGPDTHDPVHLPHQQQISLRGWVASDLLQKGPRKWQFELKAEQAQLTSQEQPALQSLKGTIKVFYRGPAPQLGYGDQVLLQGRVDLPAEALNFGAFSYRDYLKRQGIFSVFYAQQLKRLQPGSNWSLMRQLQGVRRLVLKGFETHLPIEQARLLGSLILGEGASPVPEQVKSDFQQLGLQHVLAVSGFQVQLVVWFTLALLQKLRVPRPLTVVLSLLNVWVFVLLTGAPASVLRAAAVASLFLFGYAWYKQLEILPGLLVGAAGLLLWQPGLLADIGFQFSFLATLGLILMASPLQQRLGFLPLPLAAMLAPVLSAQLWVLPAQLYHFGSFSWLFLPANLLAGLLTTALTWCALAGAVSGLLSSVMQAWVLWPAGWICSLFLASARLLLQVPEPVWQFPLLALSLTLLAYLALLTLALPLPRKALLLSTLLLSGCLLTAAGRLDPSCPLRVTYLAVGQGDAVLIEAAGQVMLIDAGPAWQSDQGWQDAGEREILPYLQRRGIRHIDLAVLSHAHLDHYGGYLTLSEKVSIGEFIGVADSGDNPMYLELLRRLQAQGVKWQSVHHGSMRQLSHDIQLIFWQPLQTQGQGSHELNDRSLVVQVVHQQVRFLFAGDLEAEGEQALLDSPGFDPRTTLLKVPHHGSRTSSGSEFLKALQPQEAVISVGQRNRFRHPSPEVVARYQAQGIRSWRTDQQGAICVCSQGQRYQIETAVTGQSGQQS